MPIFWWADRIFLSIPARHDLARRMEADHPRHVVSNMRRDLRNGKVYGQEGEVIRTCISAPEGPIEINL